MADRLYAPAELHQRMVLVARDFRKSPTPSEGILWQALRDRQINGISPLSRARERGRG